MSHKMEPIAELICELTRNCNIKEEYFASSFNLSPTEVRLLKLFAVSSEYSIKQLRDLLELTPGRITHILTSLEKKKLLIRKKDPEDNRVIVVRITPKASPLIANLQRSYQDLHKKMLENVKKEELDKILSSLETLTAVFREWVHQK
jgi:DNA-binding MarR family transcriptional regulator